MSSKQRVQVTVVVLGDLGRSPRMQYHALALAENLAVVDLIGYAGSATPRAVREQGHITVHLLPPPLVAQSHRLPHALFLSYSLLRVLQQCLQLLWLLLFTVRKPDFLLIQNPPAIPTLLVTLGVARLRSAKLVIDWHNFGYTMLSLRFGKHHPVVHLARWYERALGCRADAHFCVSRAMQSELAENWGIKGATVLYDRPAEFFASTPLHMRHDLFLRLQDEVTLPSILLQHKATMRLNPALRCAYEEETLVTTRRVLPHRPASREKSGIQLRPDRPAIIVSPTSWTADEDFSILLDAVSQCDEEVQVRGVNSNDRPFPHLLFLITGKGELREHYETRIRRLTLRKLHLRTLWLSAKDYPLLLGAADLGLCLHRSSSGLDLPMKVADMFGSGLPVCALDYGPCLAEQVRHGENGLVFTTSKELADHLYNLFQGFPDETPLLDELRHNVSESRRRHWRDDWNEHALPTFANP